MKEWQDLYYDHQTTRVPAEPPTQKPQPTNQPTTTLSTKLSALKAAFTCSNVSHCSFSRQLSSNWGYAVHTHISFITYKRKETVQKLIKNTINSKEKKNRWPSFVKQTGGRNLSSEDCSVDKETKTTTQRCGLWLLLWLTCTRHTWLRWVSYCRLTSDRCAAMETENRAAGPNRHTDIF